MNESEEQQVRQQFHFNPEKGWINDPNGLIYAGGEYHLFYQHYPHDTKWGPMHWGHATSKDLLSWEYKPIALYPTKDEYIFSGSAILDEEGNMRLFYTAHNPTTGEQKQHMAISKDYIHFEKFEGNPIIDNPKENVDYKIDFRDPKVIKNTKLGGYTMVLAAGSKIEFYHSSNMINWEKSGEFYPGAIGFDGICECPDLIDFGERYALTMSIIVNPGTTDEYHVMQYFIGDFDGNTFINTQEFSPRQLLDFGEDNYAMVSFAETDEVILMGWGENWKDARENTNDEFFGKMTLARRANLVKREGLYYIAQEPIAPKDNIKKIVSESNEMLVIEDEGYYEIFADQGIISISYNI